MRLIYVKLLDMEVAVEYNKDYNFITVKIEKDFEISIDINNKKVVFDNPSGYDSLASCRVNNIPNIIVELNRLYDTYKLAQSRTHTNGN